MAGYKNYQEAIKADIAETLKLFQCQPILFVGSGFSRRYAGGPNWETLLKQAAELCPAIDKDFTYYKQKYPNNLPLVGSIFSEIFFEWAWTKDGRNHFPPELFSPEIPRDSYLKYTIAKLLGNLSSEKAEEELQAELTSLTKLGPHAVITTNYDTLLEPLFPQYEVVVGQSVFRQSALVVGEIFKIHGSISDLKSIVLTHEDYEIFNRTKRYLSAKLLTYFAEHPLLFIGYGANDDNIKNVLYDMSRMFTPTTALIPNIYILQWDESINEKSEPVRERVLEVGDDINVRIKSISANDFRWVYEAFGANGVMEKVDLKALRSLANRMHKLIRTDIPSKSVQVNYEALEHAISNQGTFANLFGVTGLGDPGAANANHPYTSTSFAQQVGVSHWYHTNELIKKIKIDTGFDMQSFDNIYHVAIKTGQAKGSKVRKYSDAAVSLLKKVLAGEEYVIPEQVLAAQPKAKRA